MATVLHEKKIKSADRVLEIFEMFGPDRQSLTVMEVSRVLDVPQSSTSELLGNLVRRGYLTRDRGARAFRPTVRVALLGAWVHPTLFRYGRLLPLMDHLHEQTRLAVSLSSTIGVSLKHVHTIGAPLPPGLSGDAAPHLLHSPFGHVLLSPMRGDEVRKIGHRLNAESESELHVRHAELVETLEQVNRQGFALGRTEPGWSGLAVLLPQGLNEESLALGVIGRSADVEARRDDLIRAVRQGIAQFLGPRVARDSGDGRDVRIAALH